MMRAWEIIDHSESAHQLVIHYQIALKAHIQVASYQTVDFNWQITEMIWEALKKTFELQQNFSFNYIGVLDHNPGFDGLENYNKYEILLYFHLKVTCHLRKLHVLRPGIQHCPALHAQISYLQVCILTQSQIWLGLHSCHFNYVRFIAPFNSV